jgi:hypothetical protein
MAIFLRQTYYKILPNNIIADKRRMAGFARSANATTDGAACRAVPPTWSIQK